MSKSNLPIWAAIVLAGFISGMLFGIGLETGISPDENTLVLTIMKNFCEATNEFNTCFNCGSYLALLSVISFLLAIVSVFEEAMRIGDWRIGLGLYSIGWIFGLIFMVTSL